MPSIHNSVMLFIADFHLIYMHNLPTCLFCSMCLHIYYFYTVLLNCTVYYSLPLLAFVIHDTYNLRPNYNIITFFILITTSYTLST